MRAARKIIHIDMDAFFAAIEQRDFPCYRGKPLIVGGEPGKRGVVAACSYEARVFGIHSAMPSSRARRLCPDAIFVRPRFEAYQKVSSQILDIFRGYTHLVEPLSLDEAYLDVSNSGLYQGSATLIAREIKQKIYQTTRLTASAGISYNKFLAKMASGINKPDGLFVITPEQAPAFIKKLPVGKFFGIGKSTESKMHALGIYTGADLERLSKEKLRQLFGKPGIYYYDVVRGEDCRPVCANRMRKSISAESTFQEDIADMNEMLKKLYPLVEAVTGMLMKNNIRARTLTLKVRYADFRQVSRSCTVEEGFYKVSDIVQVLPTLLEKTEAGNIKVRLLGVGLGNFQKSGEFKDLSRCGQMNFFGEL